MTMRLFAAVAFDDAARAQISAFAAGLQARGVAGGFTRRENLHLTLKFLGEVPSSRADAVRAALVRAAGAFAPFTITAGRCGAFSSRGEKTVWLGFEGAELLRLAAESDGQLAREGFAPETRPFVPHVTLARRASCPEGALSEPAAPPVSCSVRAVTLFESRRDAGRLWYKPLFSAPLTGAR